MRPFFRYLLIVFTLFAAAPNVFAQKITQSITGTWTGNFEEDVLALQPLKLVVEINMYKDSIITGVSHLYYLNNKYEHYRLRGKYRRKDSTAIFMEVSTIAVDLGPIGNCLGTYLTKLSIVGNKMQLIGGWRSNDRNCGSPTTGVWLVKDLPPPPPVPEKKAVVKAPVKTPIKKPASPVTEKKPVQPVISKVTVPQPAVKIPVTPATVKPAAVVPLPPKLTKRETDVQSLLEIAYNEKDSIKIQVYDNGTIDGDSVSVYADAKEIITRKLITDKPLTFYVSLSKNNPISNLRLVAESLGSIPPCTALMIVTTKTKRYEVRLSSNFNKNATVELFLKE